MPLSIFEWCILILTSAIMIVIGLMWGGVIRGPSHGKDGAPGIKGDPGTKGDPGANGKDGRSYMYLYTGSTTLIQGKLIFHTLRRMA